MPTYVNGIQLKTLVGGDGTKTDEVDIAVGQLKLGGTATSVNGTDLSGVASPSQSTVAVAAESGNAIAVTITLKDGAGAAIAAVRPVSCWLSSSASTGAIATDDSITVTATTGLLINETVDDLYFKAVTDATGVLVLSVAHAGDATAKYLWVEFPNGKFVVSAVIDLA